MHSGIIVGCCRCIVINIPLNYILIIVGGLGISGAAIASSLAEMGSLVMLLFYVWLK